MTLEPRIAITLAAMAVMTLGCSRKPSATERFDPPPPAATAEALVRSLEIFSWDGVPASLAAKHAAPPALASAVLTRLFPRSLSSADHCPETPGTLEQARAKGWVVPRVTHHVEGSFSRVGAREVALGVRVGECGATHAEDWGTSRLVLWSEDQILYDMELRGRLAGAGDLDGDGLHELLVELGGTNQGITTTSLQVARLSPGGLKIVAELGVVYEGSCGAQKPEGEEVSLVTAVKKNDSLNFELKKEHRPCR
ncbi:MAG: hypothetical protein RMJ98_01495 [Myxococcales bacterium]|nr:hypothetical protein [Polyangiaceae bacterium]MDW8247961.1 hypothetical protein [Myxococcales bacterium]